MRLQKQPDSYQTDLPPLGTPRDGFALRRKLSERGEKISVCSKAIKWLYSRPASSQELLGGVTVAQGPLTPLVKVQILAG